MCSPKKNAMKLETLRNLYISQLQEIYSTEKQIIASLPKMAKAASNPALKKGFDQHLVETKEQAKRLEKIFRSLGVNPEGETSKPMLGLATEGQEIMASKGDKDVLDQRARLGLMERKVKGIAGNCRRTFSSKAQKNRYTSSGWRSSPRSLSPA